MRETHKRAICKVTKSPSSAATRRVAQSNGVIKISPKAAAYQRQFV
jgi:hypothetical protein